jgi:4-hydroxy-tetrahydrodipicolinate reductase
MRKKDSPSGTALTLAEMILKNVKRKKKTRTDRIDGTIKNSELHVSSTRGGEVTGTHTVYLDSFADTIELTHRAKNRSGFALGAVEAALWLHNKKGLYDFRDIIDDILDI